MTAVGAYYVATLCVQLMHSLSVMAKFLVSTSNCMVITSDKGGNVFARVCLSDCLSVYLSVSKITQKRVHGFG